MSRLESELILEIGRALAAVDQLEASLSRATEVLVEDVDASAVTSAVDEAISSASTEVDVEPDTSAVGSEVEAAIAAADPTVTPDADVTGLADEVEAAVEGADSTVTVDADTSGAEEAIGGLGETADESGSSVSGMSGDIQELGVVSGAAGGSVDGLLEVVSGLGPAGTAAAAGIGAVVVAGGALFGAAVESETANRRWSQSLGEMQSEVETINVGGLNEDLESLVTRVGQSDESVKLAGARLFDFGTSAGASADEVALTTEQVTALSLRAAALNPNLGDAGDLMERLTTGLARGGRATVDFGINLSSAEINARALKDTGKETAAELDTYEKAAAGAAIATEQLGSGLAKDLNAGAEGTQVKLAALREEFGNTLEVFGEPLLDPVLDTIEAGQPLLLELSSSLGDIAEAALPLAQNAMPLLAGGVSTLSTATDVLVPVLQIAAAVLGAIPEPILQGAGALFTITRAVNAFRSETTALSASNPILLALTAAVTAYSIVSNTNAERERARAEAIEGVEAAMQSATTTQEGYTAAVEATAEDGGHLDSALGKLGLTAGEFAELIAVSGGNLDTLSDAQLRAIGGADALALANENAADLSIEEAGALLAQAEGLKGYAEQAIEGGIATGEFTQKQVDAAIAQTTLKDGTENLVGAYEVLRDRSERIAAAQEAEREAYKATADEQTALVDSIIGTRDAMERLRDSSPEVAGLIRGIGGDSATTGEDFLGLALGLRDAELSEAEMGDAAVALGTDLATLQGYVSEIDGAIGTFADNAASKLPAVSDAFANTGKNGKLSLDEFLEGLAVGQFTISAFGDNLRALAEGGFTELAGVIAEQGPEVGGNLAETLATALESGQVEIVQAAADAVDNFQSEWDSAVEYFREVLGPQFVLETGLVGSLASSSFGSTLDFETRIALAAGLARSKLSEEGQAVALVAATEGADAATAYGAFLDLPGKTVDKAVAAGLALSANAPTGAASGAGGKVSDFWSFALDFAGPAGKATANAGPAITANAPNATATTTGQGLGANLGQGFADGIDGKVGVVEVASRRIMAAASDAISALGLFGSPSRLMRKYGGWFSEGFAIGIEDETGRIEAAATAAFTAASGAAKRTRFDPLAFETSSAAAESVRTAGRGGGMILRVERGAVQVTVDARGKTAGQVARDLGDLLTDQLLESALDAEVRWQGGRG